MHTGLKIFFLLSEYFDCHCLWCSLSLKQLCVPLWTANIYSNAWLLFLKWDTLDFLKNSIYCLKITIYSIPDTNIVALFDCVEIIFAIINIISLSINKLPYWKEHKRFISSEMVMLLKLHTQCIISYPRIAFKNKIN